MQMGDVMGSCCFFQTSGPVFTIRVCVCVYFKVGKDGEMQGAKWSWCDLLSLESTQ